MNVLVDFTWLIPPLIMATGIGLGYTVHIVLTRAQSTSDFKRATRALEDARKHAHHILREAALNARDEIIRAREQIDRDAALREAPIAEAEQRLIQREVSLERRAAMLEQREASITDRYSAAEKERRAVEEQQSALSALQKEYQSRLERVGGLTVADARETLLTRTENEIRPEIDALIQKRMTDAASAAAAQAREIIVSAMERMAAAQVSSSTTSVVTLPSEEMKGRIIGKEGRNIRSLENALGVGILIDETPLSVTISCFDPVRRELARRVLARLVEDGRIHPARIEEIAAEVRLELETVIREAGETAVRDLQLNVPSPELVHAVGRLQFRHSFSQNVLRHSVEVAHLMGIMASELGLNPDVARRVGLFHDLGKAMDHHEEGSHAAIGARLLERCGEDPVVIAAVEGHHRDGNAAENIYASLAAAADAVTAARPGARVESTELFLDRLEKLETLANAFPGVAGSYALQAGRELRVIVRPSEIDDSGALRLAQELARKIQEQVRFPGVVKVTVIRETRCVEYAK